MDVNFEQARRFFLEGLAHYEAGRFAEAERQFAAALALVPGRPSALTNLGAARIRLGRHDEAATVLEEAVRAEPGNAEAWGHLGTALAELGRLPQALQAFESAVTADPSAGPAWMLRGNVLRDLGRCSEAAASYREALVRGGDAALCRYYLASVADDAEAPPAAPPAYVAALFDGYAPAFEAELVQGLRYRAPQVLLAPLQAAGRRFARALDLGCGTGLCAPLLRPLAGRLEGVDLSAGMLEQAAARGQYDALHQAELVAWLAGLQGTCDLVVATDVFIYIGELGPVFAGVARVMEAGGVFCFSIEEPQPGEGDVVLRPSLRYAHAEAYLRRLAAAHGFSVQDLQRAPVREDQGQAIAGLYMWLEKR
jgi:predicted TPR repeat methyltransferase